MPTVANQSDDLLRMLSPSTKLWLRVGGVWKETTVYIRVGGVWKTATPAIKAAGVWE
jgi:hypothetical protein